MQCQIKMAIIFLVFSLVCLFIYEHLLCFVFVGKDIVRTSNKSYIVAHYKTRQYYFNHEFYYFPSTISESDHSLIEKTSLAKFAKTFKKKVLPIIFNELSSTFVTKPSKSAIINSVAQHYSSQHQHVAVHYNILVNENKMKDKNMFVTLSVGYTFFPSS
jgi:hypothetical protein